MIDEPRDTGLDGQKGCVDVFLSSWELGFRVPVAVQHGKGMWAAWLCILALVLDQGRAGYPGNVVLLF
jgi:hypothetical protein